MVELVQPLKRKSQTPISKALSSLQLLLEAQFTIESQCPETCTKDWLVQSEIKALKHAALFYVLT